MTKHDEQSHEGFDGLGIRPKILESLQKLNLERPTPIQKKAIPVAIEGEDLIGIAQTGTGKTFAFGIPMLQRLALHKGKGLVLLPTRELALQVDENLKKLGGSLGLRTAALIGGEPIGRQMQLLRQRPHIFIATPGRLNDFIKRKQIGLSDVRVLVLDEADMMLDMGFMPQVEEILAHIPRERQTMLFSATMPTAIVKLATKYMDTPVNVEVAPAGTTAEKVEQEMHIVKKEERVAHLGKILKEHSGSVLVFVRTKHGAKALTKNIKQMGHDAAEIHSNRSFEQRKSALAGFKSGKHRVLVATDIAARGIDINDIKLVVNFDLPDNSEDYVHRIGRTARAGKEGKAISFALPTQSKDIKTIERLIKKELELVKHAELLEVQRIRPSFSNGGKRVSFGKPRFGSRRGRR